MANVTFGEPRFKKPETKDTSKTVVYETDGHYSDYSDESEHLIPEQSGQ